MVGGLYFKRRGLVNEEEEKEDSKVIKRPLNG